MPRAITHPSPKIPPREMTIPESLSKLRTFGKDAAEFKTDSELSPNESIVSASLKISIEQARPKSIGQAKRQNPPKEHLSNLLQLQPCLETIPIGETYQLSFPSVRATTSLSPEASPVSKPASCRTTSKIPTPLPRKTAKSSPTSPDSVLTSLVSKSSSSKAHNANNKSSNSQSPCSIRRTSETTTVEISSSVSPQTSSAEFSPSSRLPAASARRHDDALLPAERRRTVVEVCEKVVVPQGKAPMTPPVTPFITVNCVNTVDKRTTPVAEVRSDQQAGNASKNS